MYVHENFKQEVNSFVTFQITNKSYYWEYLCWGGGVYTCNVRFYDAQNIKIKMTETKVGWLKIEWNVNHIFTYNCKI